MGTDRRLKAGVLPFVLAISLVLALVCSAAILLTYYHQVSILQQRIAENLRINVSSGFQYALAGLPGLPEKEWVGVDLYGAGEDSVKIRKESWGVFHILNVEAFKGRHRHSGVAMAGNHLKSNKPALYLEDNQRPLSIAGDTKISGDAYLPKAGIRTDYVNRIGYSRERMVYGEIMDSSPEQPQPDVEMLRQLNELLYSTAGKGGELRPPISYSFQEQELLGLRYSEAFVLKDTLSGKIILRSSKQIIVKKGAYVRDVILAAPKILIEEGFEGQLQAYATDSIIVEKDVLLAYPSALGVLSEQDKSYIELQSNATIEGLVFHFSGDGDRDGSFHLLRLTEGAAVLGEVWSNGFVELQGQTGGTLSCRRFYLETPSTHFENYIFNGKIEREMLPSFFVSSGMLNPEGKRNMVKWLY